MTEENNQELINSPRKMFRLLEKGKGSSDEYFSFLDNYGNYPCEGFAENIDESSVEKSIKRRRINNEEEGIKDKEEGIEEVEDRVLAMTSKDPLVVFGLDIMNLILNCLDASGLASCLLVSRRWQEVASSDKLWSPLCEELWRGKAHIPRIAKLPGMPKLAVYSLSAIDGKRTRITRDDLCDHVWEFRFNKDAPEYWRRLDPSWEGNGSPPMRRYFHHDGSQTADPEDMVWGGHEASFCTVTGINADDTIRAHYVRINRWPPLSISRKSDWTWEMSSRLVRYTSIPDTEKEDGTGPPFTGF